MWGEMLKYFNRYRSPLKIKNIYLSLDVLITEQDMAMSKSVA